MKCDIKVTYFQEYSTGKKVYSVKEAEQWLSEGKEFYLVGVLPWGDTRRTSQSTRFEDNVFFTASGSEYNFVGLDEKRFKPTHITLIEFKVGDFFFFDSPSPEQVLDYVNKHFRVVAQFKTEDGVEGFTGPIVSIDPEKRTFVTKSEHTYVF